MKTAREWILSQPGGNNFDAIELARAIATIEARDSDVRAHTLWRVILWQALAVVIFVVADAWL